MIYISKSNHKNGYFYHKIILCSRNDFTILIFHAKFINYRSIHQKHPDTKTGKYLIVKYSDGTLSEVQSAIAANYTWTRLSIYRVYTEWKREACKPPRQYLETSKLNSWPH